MSQGALQPFLPARTLVVQISTPAGNLSRKINLNAGIIANDSDQAALGKGLTASHTSALRDMFYMLGRFLFCHLSLLFIFIFYQSSLSSSPLCLRRLKVMSRSGSYTISVCLRFLDFFLPDLSGLPSSDSSSSSPRSAEVGVRTAS